MNQELSANSLLTGAQVFTGAAAAKKNLDSVLQIYNSIKTSYGPFGLDKMCVDASGTVSITNDGATILKNMLVEDPAARLMVNLALEQDKEVGDGTTSVVIIASDLIRKGIECIQEGVHPSVVISGYRLAFNESMKFIKEKIAKKLDPNNENLIGSIIDTCISSKIIYQERELFVEIAKKCLDSVVGDKTYDVDRINFLKSVGGSMRESLFFDGCILNCTVASPLMKRALRSPKIACLDMSLSREKLPLTVNIRVTDPEKLEQIRREELEMTRSKSQAIIDSGATVVLCTGGIDEMYIKMFVDSGIVAVKRVGREDLENIAVAAGTALKKTFVGEDCEYCLDTLGECGEFEVKAVGDHELCHFSGFKKSFPTVMIKGPNVQIVDEVQRALNDAIQVLKRTLESKSVVPGGGAVECALCFLLEDFSDKINAKEHAAIYKYAEALLEIPKLLAANAGLDASQLVSKMLQKQCKTYEMGITDKFYGIDVVKDAVCDNFENGVVEPTTYKLKALKAATEAAISILRISEVVVFPNNK